MEVTFQTLFNISLGVLLTVFGFGLREGWRMMREMQKEITEGTKKAADDVHNLETKVSEEYVRKEDLNYNLTEIKDMLGKIFDKLDKKVDK